MQQITVRYEQNKATIHLPICSDDSFRRTCRSEHHEDVRRTACGADPEPDPVQ